MHDSLSLSLVRLESGNHVDDPEAQKTDLEKQLRDVEVKLEKWVRVLSLALDVYSNFAAVAMTDYF